MNKKEIKKSRHSRVLLSGIFNACRRVLSYGKQQNVEDPRLQTSGMTPYFMKSRAFTLIELLVVVLIIGILSAIALPQYQKAVTKTKLANLKILVNSVAQAAEEYYLANNTYPSSFDEIVVSMPPKISGTDAHYEYSDSYCDLENGSEASVSCRNTEVGIAYIQRFLNISSGNRGKRSCSALNTNSAAVAVCKAETGQTTPYYTANNWESFWY